MALWPSKVAAFGNEVDKRRNELLNYIIFLRLTPILPNTFINVASPIVGVSLLPFTLGELLSRPSPFFVSYDIQQICLESYTSYCIDLLFPGHF